MHLPNQLELCLNRQLVARSGDISAVQLRFHRVCYRRKYNGDVFVRHFDKGKEKGEDYDEKIYGENNCNCNGGGNASFFLWIMVL